jgi:predicted dehydrogenase
MKRLRAAVIGVGHLGKEHARIFSTLPEVELVGVADLNHEQAQTIARRLNTQAYSDYWPLLNLVDIASIAVPTCDHHAVAREFLRRGIPLLIEKPLARTSAEAQELVQLAEQHHTLLQVGHIERFNPAFEDLCSRSFQPQFIRAQRLAPFTGRSSDIGVVLDLMIHDLDLLLALVGAPLQSAEAIGINIFGTHEDIANARLQFANGCVAEVTASRASPTVSRQMQLWGAEGYAELDFGKRSITLMQPAEAVRRNGLDPARLDAASRSRIREELFTRHLELTTLDGKVQDQLTCELQHFVTCVKTNTQPRVSGKDGWSALSAAEAVLQNMRRHCWIGTTPPLLFAHKVDQEVA